MKVINHTNIVFILYAILRTSLCFAIGRVAELEIGQLGNYSIIRLKSQKEIPVLSSYASQTSHKKLKAEKSK